MHRALRDDDATAAAAVTTVAAVAAAMAAMPAVAASMATIATVAAVAAVAATMTTAMAAVAAIAAITAVSSAVAEEQASLSLLLATDQGNPDQGEKQSNTENNNAVHPRILQLLTGTVS
ncbi:MAG: hypothetical protein L0211_06145 [Planctomycetaceae bacterium]|nr:hypothetical protein [Planctomycetaceae bacterium]